MTAKSRGKSAQMHREHSRTSTQVGHNWVGLPFLANSATASGVAALRSTRRGEKNFIVRVGRYGEKVNAVAAPIQGPGWRMPDAPLATVSTAALFWGRFVGHVRHDLSGGTAVLNVSRCS
jgi:hypothetical protein